MPSRTAEDVLSSLAALPPDVLTVYLKNEYPQTVAALLVLADRATAAAVLARLPESFMREVVRRMAVAVAPRDEVRELVLATFARRLPELERAAAAADRPAMLAAVAALCGHDMAETVGREAAAAAPVPEPETPGIAAAVLDGRLSEILSGEAAAPRPPEGFADPETARIAAEWDALQEEARAEEDVVTRVGALVARLAAGRRDPEPEPPECEPLPVLEGMLTRLCRTWGETLRDLTGVRAEVSLDQLSSVRYGDLVGSVPLPAMFGVVATEGLDGPGLAVLDSALIYAAADLLLGARAPTCMRIEGRPYTEIERALAGLVLGRALDELGRAFAPTAPAAFRVERIETDPRFAAVCDGTEPCVVAKLRVDLDGSGCGGRLALVLPYSALAPVRAVLSSRPPAWERAKAGLFAAVEAARFGGGDPERLAAEIRAFVGRVEGGGLLGGADADR